MHETTFYILTLTVHLLAVATWFGGNIFFIGFVALSRREPFLAGIRARLIYIYATAFRTTTYYILGFILLSGIGLVHAHGLLNKNLFTLPLGRMALMKLSIFLVMTGLQLVHDFVIGPRSYNIDGENISVREDMRGTNRFVGWTVFIFTLVLFMTGVFLSRKILIF